MQQYNVGGLMMARPFEVRRLGHLGLNCADVSNAARFYTEKLGFRVTDEENLFEALPEADRQRAGEVMRDPRLIFTSNSADHHALVVVDRAFDQLGLLGEIDETVPADVTFNQISWQLGSLEEVVGATEFLTERGVRIGRIGRDMPGSNWAVYFRDPEGNTLEFYYGMEQIGWSGMSKPTAMHERASQSRPALPQPSEAEEVDEALTQGISLCSGRRSGQDGREAGYDVGGVRLERPFKVTRLGPLSLFTDMIDVMEAFYTDVLGFRVTEVTHVRGSRVVFLRNGTEHHSLVLAEKPLRAKLQLSDQTSCIAIGMEVGSYAQLQRAASYLRDCGHEQVTVPPEMHAGIDYAAYFKDPDGQLVELYYYMEQIGWDGKPRPAELRRPVTNPWPETLEPLSDTHAGPPFVGPLG